MHIFIDSVPDNLEAKYYLNELIEDFNNSKIPSFIYDQFDEEKGIKHQGTTSWMTIKKI